jgi:5-methyltetrahydropteroyltriglutamate--homocysteine methyltransferase
MSRAAHNMKLPQELLATTVIGSYSVPEWLGQLRNEYYQRRISRRYLDEIHETAIKAALLDQERAGIDIVTDGELRRDNDIDYLIERIPGVEVSHRSKLDYFDYLEADVTSPLPVPGGGGVDDGDGDAGGDGLGLVADFRFLRQLTELPVKVSLTGPFSLSRRIRNSAYPNSADLVRDLARALSAEAGRLASAGAQMLQIDEPFLAGYPEDVDLAVEAINIVTKGAAVHWTLHVCYGNRHARPLWAGHYDFLFPAVKAAHVDRLALEFARTGDEDLQLLEQYQWDRGLGLGVIDVKTEQVESAEQVAARIRRALRFLPADKLVINPDCGLRHLPPEVARAKLAAMVAGAVIVRAELPAEASPTRTSPTRTSPTRTSPTRTSPTRTSPTRNGSKSAVSGKGVNQ